jgi:lysine-ketoglutarate reductase/saccharopine dehydrogenase-like protein (TIGR00300 family)
MSIAHRVEAAPAFVEDVELHGHIIDSLILPKVLDVITSRGGSFQIKQIVIGQGRGDPSNALIQVQAASQECLDEILEQISDHGAVPTAAQDCRLVAADIAGAFPEGFYSTTNQKTEVRLEGHWIEVADQEMDCGIVVDRGPPAARCLAMSDIGLGDMVVVGHAGVRVFPHERDTQRQMFEFMGSSVSTEKPKGVAVREIASELFKNRASGGKSLVVGGPAIVHTGSGSHLAELIRRGYVNVLFAGNALATHDIEQALFGTSLGIHLERGIPTEEGHEHHLRAINRIRRAGSFRAAVDSGLR